MDGPSGRTAHARAGVGEKPKPRLGPEEEAEEGGERHGNPVTLTNYR